jgi:peptidylprolyl isomerase
MLDMTGGKPLGSFGVPNLKLAVKNNPCITMRSLKKTISKTQASDSARSKMPTFRRASALAAFSLMAALTAAVPDASHNKATAQTAGKSMTTASGLQISDSKVGTGATPKPGQTCVMHYTGWLYENGVKGKKFDSSVDRNEPFEFPIGQRKVIAGWDEGVATMKVGGKRTLIIPPQLGYGARGAGGVIPPNATLVFDVELLDVKG